MSDTNKNSFFIKIKIDPKAISDFMLRVNAYGSNTLQENATAAFLTALKKGEVVVDTSQAPHMDEFQIKLLLLKMYVLNYENSL